MPHRTRLLISLIGLALACSDPPVPTAELLGRWEWTRGSNLLGQGEDARGVRFHLLVKTWRSDSVFGVVESHFNPDGKLECGVLWGARATGSRLRLVVAGSDSSVIMILSGMVNRQILRVDDARGPGQENVIATGAWLVFTKVSSDTSSGCLTSA